MAISDSQFLERLKGKDSKNLTNIVEVDFAYQTASGPAVGTLRFSDKPYDRDPVHRYYDMIERAPTFERAIDARTLGGRGSRTIGALVLDSPDDSAGFLLDAIVDAREVRSYAGMCDWQRHDFRLMGVALVQSVADSGAKVTVSLRDKSYLLDETIIGDTIGSGPNAGKPKPVVFGRVSQVDLTPYLLDASGPTYLCNNYAQADPYFLLAGIRDVRDAGVSLIGTGFSGDNAAITVDTGTETITRVAHGLSVNDVIYFSGTTPWAGISANLQYWVIAAGLTADNFRISLTRGGAAVNITGAFFAGTLTINKRRFYVDAAAATVTLSSSPSGRVTCDYASEGVSGDAFSQEVPHAAFRYILDNWTQLTAADRDAASFATLYDAEVAAAYLWGFAVLDRVNVTTLLDEIALLTNSWYGWNASGVLTVGKLALATLDTGAAPIDTVTADDIVGLLSCENLPLQFGKLSVDTNRNVVTQTDGLAGSVSETNRSLWARKYRVRATTTDPGTATYLENWWDYHKSAIDSKPLETSFHDHDSLHSQTMCDERTSLFKPWTRVYRCTVGLDKYELNPGDCITLQYPRYGLDDGKPVRVLSVNTRLSDGAVDLVMVRQVTPDYTMADHV